MEQAAGGGRWGRRVPSVNERRYGLEFVKCTTDFRFQIITATAL